MSVYHSNDEARPAVCATPKGAKPAGLLKQATDPTPATGAAVVTSYVYDQWGRVLGTKRSGDAGWTCTTYDARGRGDQADPSTAAESRSARGPALMSGRVKSFPRYAGDSDK